MSGTRSREASFGFAEHAKLLPVVRLRLEVFEKHFRRHSQADSRPPQLLEEVTSGQTECYRPRRTAESPIPTSASPELHPLTKYGFSGNPCAPSVPSSYFP